MTNSKTPTLPFTFGARTTPDYYKNGRGMRRPLEPGGELVQVIHPDADPSDVMEAFGVSEHPLCEIIAKVLRLGRKSGTEVEQEMAKVMEHAQIHLENLSNREMAENPLVEVKETIQASECIGVEKELPLRIMVCTECKHSECVRRDFGDLPDATWTKRCAICHGVTSHRVAPSIQCHDCSGLKDPRQCEGCSEFQGSNSP